MMDYLIIILLAMGTFFFAVGTLGLVRLPDVYTRIHATTKSDTMGAGLILLAVCLHSGYSWPTLKVLAILAFLWLTNPTGSHLMASAVYSTRIVPVREIEIDSCEEGND